MVVESEGSLFSQLTSFVSGIGSDPIKTGHGRNYRDTE